jgi:DNA-binding CsgD family transcriptional regulator
MLVEAHIAASDPEGAAVAAARLKTLAATHGRGYVTALASDATGQVAMARGRPDEAVAELERALDLFSRLDLPLQAARVRLNVARARAAEGRLEIAVAEARSGLKVFDNLGAAIDGDAAAELLRSLGATGRIGPRGTGVLSRREREVLQLVGLGLSNPEIAQRLFISRKTVAHHVSSVLAKLGLRNRAEAVAHAARQRS